MGPRTTNTSVPRRGLSSRCSDLNPPADTRPTSKHANMVFVVVCGRCAFFRSSLLSVNRSRLTRARGQIEHVIILQKQIFISWIYYETCQQWLSHARPRQTMPCQATLDHTKPHNGKPRHAKSRQTTPRQTTPRQTTQCQTTPHHATPNYAMLNHATPNHATPRQTMPHHTKPRHDTSRQARSRLTSDLQQRKEKESRSKHLL